MEKIREAFADFFGSAGEGQIFEAYKKVMFIDCRGTARYDIFEFVRVVSRA